MLKRISINLKAICNKISIFLDPRFLTKLRIVQMRQSLCFRRKQRFISKIIFLGIKNIKINTMELIYAMKKYKFWMSFAHEKTHWNTCGECGSVLKKINISFLSSEIQLQLQYFLNSPGILRKVDVSFLVHFSFGKNKFNHKSFF